MRLKTIASVLGLVLVLVLLPATLAAGDFRGTDMWSQLAPADSGGRVSQYPLSYFTLDYHVDGPGVLNGFGDIVGLVGQFLAAQIFMIVTFFMRVTISAFDWAFNIDIIGGRHGALGAVGNSTKHLYTSTFLPLMTTAVLIFGGWFVYKILGRRFGEAGVGLVRAVCLSAVALVLIFNYTGTIGRAASLSNDLAGAIASGTTGGNGGQDVSDRLFNTFVFQPWAVLEFGGLKRCVSAQKDDDGFPKPVGVNSPDRAVCRDVMRENSGGYGGYASKFLRYAPGSDERKKVFEAIKDGEAPDDPHIPGWKVDKADAPAVDMMQGEGAIQRLAYVALLSLGIISAILLLGLICFGALFVQGGLLVLFAATPAMVIAGIFPGLHGVFWMWAKWIGKLLIAKAIYALVLAAALGVSAALMAAGAVLGYLFVFAAQTALFLGLFIKRKALAEQVSNRRDYNRSENSTKSFVSGAAAGAVGAVASPAAAAAAVGKSRLSKIEQQHAKSPDSQKPAADPQQTSAGQSGEPRKRVDSSSPPATAGREYSPSLDSEGVNQDKPSARAEAMPPPPRDEQETQEKGDPMPTRSFREDFEQARAEAKPQPYGEQRKPPPVDPLRPDGTKPTPPAFAEHLEQERAKTPGS